MSGGLTEIDGVIYQTMTATGQYNTTTKTVANTLSGNTFTSSDDGNKYYFKECTDKESGGNIIITCYVKQKT